MLKEDENSLGDLNSITFDTRNTHLNPLVNKRGNIREVKDRINTKQNRVMQRSVDYDKKERQEAEELLQSLQQFYHQKLEKNKLEARKHLKKIRQKAAEKNVTSEEIMEAATHAAKVEHEKQIISPDELKERQINAIQSKFRKQAEMSSG
jgi:hypothetical protein